MKERMRNDLEIIEEKGIKNSSLFIKNIKVNVESYEAKILSEDNIQNLIKYQIVYDGEERLLKYDVSETIAFDEYIKTKKLSKRDLIDILRAIDDVLSSAENYLISENAISLNLKLLRVCNKGNGKVKYKFIGIPNHSLSFSYELSSFLIRVLRFVDVDDKDALTLGYGLFVRSSKDNYTMNDLMELIDLVDDNRGSKLDVSFEDLVDYDEAMAKEISEEIIESNRVDLFDYNCEEVDNDNEEILNFDDSESKIALDTDTKNMLEESIFNDFDKGDKKIIKFKKKIVGNKKKRALGGHIKVGLLLYFLAPILVVILPLVYYLMYGLEKFVENMPYIFAIVTVMLLALFIWKIVEYRVGNHEQSC